MSRAAVFAALLAVPAAAQDAFEAHVAAWDGFLDAATAAIPGCEIAAPAPTDEAGEPVLPLGDGKPDCAVLVTVRGETWATATYAELVIAAPVADPPVRLRVEGADWSVLRQGLAACLDGWLADGTTGCAPVDWKARALAAEADLARLLGALRVLGMAVEAGR